MSYSTIKQLVMGGNGASKITTLEPAKATAILDGLDLSQLAQKQAETDTKNSTAEAVFLWAEKLLRMVSRDENPDTVALLKARMAAATDGVVSAVGGQERAETRFTNIEQKNFLPGTYASHLACHLELGDFGYFSEHGFENGVELYLNGSDYTIYGEYDSNWTGKRPGGIEIERSIEINLGLKNFAVVIKNTNCSLLVPGTSYYADDSNEEGLAIDKTIIRDDPVQGIKAPEASTVLNGWVQFDPGEYMMFTLEPENSAQTCSSEFLVKTKVANLVTRLNIQEAQFAGRGPRPLTDTQILDFFKRYLAEDEVANIFGKRSWGAHVAKWVRRDFWLARKVEELKQAALDHWVVQQREEHQAWYQQLGIADDEILLSYGKVTKPASSLDD